MLESGTGFIQPGPHERPWTSEAVLTFNRFEDGKLILTETGATPLSDDYQLIGT